MTSAKRRRNDLVHRLGIEPTIAARLKGTLGPAVDAAAARSPGGVTVLDAGCGRTSPLISFRDRIDRFVGVDIHAPATPLPYLDEFATVDLCGDGRSFAEGSFDLVLSNPPYLAIGEAPHLPPTVRDHDPRRALFAGDDGMAAIRHLLATAPAALAEGGLLVFEIGFGQAEAVRSEILARPAWRFVAIEDDLEGIPRICIARRESAAERAGRIRRPWTGS